MLVEGGDLTMRTGRRRNLKRRPVKHKNQLDTDFYLEFINYITFLFIINSLTLIFYYQIIVKIILYFIEEKC